MVIHRNQVWGQIRKLNTSMGMRQHMDSDFMHSMRRVLVIRPTDMNNAMSCTLHPFELKKFSDALMTSKFGKNVIVVDWLSGSAISPEPWLKTLISKELREVGGDPVVLALRQGKAIGRNDRVWQESADPGNSLSMVINTQLHSSDLERYYNFLPSLQFVGALAVHSYICQQLKNTSSVAIKWPNDVLVCRNKLAGILCKAENESKSMQLAIGIGMNLGRCGLPSPYLSLEHFINKRPDYSTAAAEVLNHFEHWYNCWSTDIKLFMKEYVCRWVHKESRVLLPNGKMAAIKNATETGCLELETDDKETVLFKNAEFSIANDKIVPIDYK